LARERRATQRRGRPPSATAASARRSRCSHSFLGLGLLALGEGALRIAGFGDDLPLFVDDTQLPGSRHANPRVACATSSRRPTCASRPSPSTA